MSKVKLAIRVRPFTERELRSEAAREPVVRVEDEHTLSITNLKVASSGAGDSRMRVRRYNADYCLDSSCAADHPSYASQEKVYSTVGQEVLETVLGGRSACVLAYGQSATGKTHSMLGTAADPGLVPRLCRELAAAAQEQHVTVSFLEIYNERVRDLLDAGEALAAAAPALLGCGSLPRRRGNTFKDLRVREHPTKGPYVQNLRRVVVRDPEQLCALVWAGVERRHAAHTRRNPLSSRSHALLQLTAGAGAATGLPRLTDVFLSTDLRRVVVRDPEQLCALVWAGVERRRAAATRRNPLSSRSHALLQLTAGAGAATGLPRLTDVFISTDLRRVVVRDPEQLCALVWAGVERRRAAATRRNPLSSRSHALLQLTAGAATLHLADLAGSENAGLEGAYGSRQKEGANINKSLVALSNVISALVRLGSGGGGGGGRGRYVPYRDSALTWLLKDCFTGGAATFILATVAASSACYSESASTLRWAAAARQLTAAEAGVGRGYPAAAAAVRAHTSTALLLQHQLDTLRATLVKNHIRYVPETGFLEPDLKYWDKKIIFERDNQTPNSVQIKAEEMNSTDNVISLDNNAYGSNESSITSTSSDRHEDKQLKGSKSSNDNLFTPVLERAVSGYDLTFAVPIRNKKRQYKSHEVLPNISKRIINSRNEATRLKSDIIVISKEENEILSFKSDEQTKKTVPKVHVPYEIENPRAEIVASVTERLYSKLKKKEQLAKSKVENAVEKKIMEPLHELKICTNARERLADMSQRALRMRKKIGIAAHTQTRDNITRVKDQATESQNDLEPFCVQNNNSHKHCCNVYTETELLTPRCREVSTGPVTGSLHNQDISTLTEDHYVAVKSCSIMTEDIQKTENSTQTIMIPPPRKKKSSAFTKFLAQDRYIATQQESNATSIINISISQMHSSESESLSDDSLQVCGNHSSLKSNMPPDLLNNHNPMDQDIQLSPLVLSTAEDIAFSNENATQKLQNNVHQSHELQQEIKCTTSLSQTSRNKSSEIVMSENDEFVNQKNEDIFSDSDEQASFPRSIGYSIVGADNFNNMILGRNLSAYPYNLTLSPNVERNSKCKKTVKFEPDTPPKAFASVGTQTLYAGKLMDKDDGSIASCGTSPQINCNDLNKTQTFPNHIFKFTNKSNAGKLYRPNQILNSSTSSCTRSNTSLTNLMSSTLYKPIYLNRSPSYEKTIRSTPSNIYKRFLFNDGEDSCNYAPMLQTTLNDKNIRNCCSPKDYISADTSDYTTDFEGNIQFFESKSRRKSDLRWKYEKGFNYCYETDERKIKKSCKDLEKSIEEHEKYIRHLNNHRLQQERCVDVEGITGSLGRPPSEYFQQLLQERRNVVNEAKLNHGQYHSIHNFG